MNFNKLDLSRQIFRKGFTKIKQFDDICQLNSLVVSDHTEIVMNTEYGMISAWNISNPVYHYYFKSFDTATLAKTHMCGEQDFLDEKIDKQIDYIVENVERLPVQIIIEGYISFFNNLKNKLDKSNKNYALIYQQEIPQEVLSTMDKSTDEVNLIGILVNTDKYNITDSYLYTEKYVEEGDRITKFNPVKRTNVAMIPIVYLNPIDTDQILVVIGVHVRGSNSRNPISGIEIYNKLVNDLISNYESNLYGIVMMGDWNSMPSNTRKIMKNVKLLTTDYPTHTNPGTEVSFYDHAYIYKIPNAELLSIDYTSPFSQALYESVIRSRLQYLESLDLDQ